MASSFKTALIALALFLSVQNHLYAWGKTGHRIVGQVAQENLSEKSKKLVKELLDGRDLADVANFADEVRSDSHYDEYIPLHYVTIPRGQNYDNSSRNPQGDVISGIEKFTVILKDQSLPLAKRKEALKYIIHLIGDLHQPLHVGEAHDHGGNDVKLKWFGVDSNLHKVWDENLIQFEELSYNDFASMLGRFFAKGKSEQWMSGDVKQWAHESQELRTSIYPQAGETDLKYSYHYKHKDLLYQRLYQGGLRLAYYLNLNL